MRVLVVEDERVLADAIAEGLRDEAMAVDVVYDGDEALELASYNEYDVVVLDRDCPRCMGTMCAANCGATQSWADSDAYRRLGG